MNLGFTELLLIGGIVLLLFGPSRLPGLGKSLGEAIRGFKKGINDDSRDVTSTTTQQIPHQVAPQQPFTAAQPPHYSTTAQQQQATNAGHQPPNASL